MTKLERFMILTTTLSLAVIGYSQVNQTSNGANSPNISGATGNVVITEGGTVRPRPHRIADDGCNMWVIDYGPGISEDDVFLSGAIDDDGAAGKPPKQSNGEMYYGKDAMKRAMETYNRLQKQVTCDRSGKKLPR